MTLLFVAPACSDDGAEPSSVVAPGPPETVAAEPSKTDAFEPVPSRPAVPSNNAPAQHPQADAAQPSRRGEASDQAPSAPSSPSDPSSDTDLALRGDTPPRDDPFYRPPPLKLAAGEILRTRTSQFSLDLLGQGPEANVVARQVLYQSIDALGKPMAVSGTVLLPTTPWAGPGSRPLVSYAVGTRGLGDDCAPSYSLTNGADYEGTIIRSLLDQGWAVAISDYQGLGTPGLHTYMVGPAEGHAVLDMARAAQRLDGTGLTMATPVGLMGYSQGGGAAGWAAQLAATYAPELNVKGAAIGGVPGDLAATAEFLDGSAVVAFALLAALGLDAAYPELDLASYLNDRGRQLVESHSHLCLASIDGFSGLLGDTLFTSFADYVTSNPLKTPAWQARLAETQLGAATPTTPVFQYHALLDEIVPFDQAAELRRRWCDQGADVTWNTLPVEHALGIALGPPFAIAWLAERFENKPTASNCQDP